MAVVVPPAEREGAGEEGGDVVAVASTMPPNNARCFLLDCDEALPGIVAHLDGKGLAALGSTCKHLRELVNGHDGKRWWKRLCWTLLVGKENPPPPQESRSTMYCTFSRPSARLLVGALLVFYYLLLASFLS